MNVAAFIVAAMNIPQIIECSSPSPTTFDILFCLFRTRSFTRFTNDLENVEEDGLLSSKLRTQRESDHLVQCQSTFFY